MSLIPLLVAAAAILALPAAGRADPLQASVASLPLDRLKATYLACDRAASRTTLDAESFSRCARVGDELLKRGFEGDLDRLLAWWREEKARSTDAGAAAER